MDEVRRRVLVNRAIADVGSAWEYFGRIADTRGFAYLAAGTIDELMQVGFTGTKRKATGRLADIFRLFAGYLKLDPSSAGPDSPEDRPIPTGGLLPRVELIEAPGLVGEARLVARRIRELLAEGISPDGIVVTARDVGATADVFAEVFAEYEVPARGFPAAPLARAPAVAFLVRAWRVPAGGYAFADVAEVLRSSFFRPAGSDPELALKTESLLRRIGGPDGKDAFLRAVERWAEKPMAPLDDEGPETGTRRRIESLARTCRPFLQTFFTLWDDVPSRAKPAAWVDRFRRFARECGVEPATHPNDAAALETLWIGLATWVEAVPAKAVPTSDFAAALSTVTATAPMPTPDVPSTAVRVLAAEDARSTPCDYLFLTGLGEGSFPRLAPPDSLLSDADRSELRTAGYTLPDPAGRRDAERSLFDDLLARPAKLLVLSFPATDAKGLDQLPSSFLADWRVENPHVRATSRKMLIQEYAKGELYSDAERRVHFADALLEGTERPVPNLSSPVVATIHRARQVASARFGTGEFGRFDGGFRPSVLAANRDLLGPNPVFDPGHVFSPTALEPYVACPFKFWLGHVLGVEPLDDPPDAVEQTRRGSAIHRALKRVHEAGCEDPAAVCGHFDEAAAEYAARCTGGVTAALWELEALRLRRTATRYPAQWAAFREKESKAGPIPVPKLFEAAFGLPPDPGKSAVPPLVVSVDGIEVRICGSVDRIDVAETADGLGVWVIDYKSGRGTYYTGAGVARLEQLQLPLYALAAERVLFPGRPVRPLGLAYWLVTDTGAKGVLPKKVEWSTFRDQLERWVATLVDRIRSGSFPLAPRSKDCTATCRHGPVCRITQHRNSAKRSDLPPPGAAGVE